MRHPTTAALLLMLAAGPAQAKVVGAAPYGFEVAETVATAAAPAKVFQALADVAHWWSPSHS